MPKERWDQRRKTGFLGEESNDQLLQTKLGPWDSYVEALTLNMMAFWSGAFGD